MDNSNHIGQMVSESPANAEFRRNREIARAHISLGCSEYSLDPRTPELLERGCYNYAIAQARALDRIPYPRDAIICEAYSAALAKILWNLDKHGPGKTGNFAEGLRSGRINPRVAASIPVEDLNPDSLALEKADIARRENTSDPLNVSKRYKCPQCSEKSTRIRNEQTRCSDEAPTGFADCTECGYTWKIY